MSPDLGAASLLPALVAILLALLTRQVLPSLLTGVVLGAGLAHGTVTGAFFRALDALVSALADADKAKIVLFTLTMGGMVGVVGATGGARGLAGAFGRAARSRRGAGLVSSALGLLFFFDDYASSLMVGTTMRPVTDRLRISREKLAYIVDSTSAPVASLALVSTWVGYEVGVMQDAMQSAGIDRGGYEVFLAGILARFYPWLALWMVLVVTWSGRDFGPMRTAEQRAASGGGLLRPGAQPLMDVEATSVLSDEAPPSLIRGLLPVLALVITVVAVLGVTGWTGAASDPAALERAFAQGKLRGLGVILGEAASYDALVYGSGTGALVAVIAGATAGQAGASLSGFMRGVRSTLDAVEVLVLAWALGGVMDDLDAGAYVAGTLGDALPGWTLPTLVFLTSAGLAFATGTSWGTMAIVFPIAMPLVAAHPGAEALLLGSTAGVLAGAVFGDHCSPISDTTVLSSVASASDHADHTRTQAPYALVVGAVSVLLGTLPLGLGVPAWMCLAAGGVAIVLVVRIVGQPAEPREDSDSTSATSTR